MRRGWPAYLDVEPGDVGRGTPVKVVVVGDMADLACHMAEAMLAEITGAQAAGRTATLIVPVGPVDQFPLLAGMINERGVDCRDVMLINMDEYLDDHDQFIDADHPLSFRRYMNRLFYDRLDAKLAPRLENRIFPDPNDVEQLGEVIRGRGGIDACFGGIGINGHMAFNEPPPEQEQVSPEDFATWPTRVLDLTPHTRTINSVTVGGEIAVIPRRAVTVGMKEILESRRLRFYCNRPWQSAVVRRVLHGPIEAACPASLMRMHKDATLTLTDYVAAKPDIRLR